LITISDNNGNNLALGLNPGSIHQTKVISELAGFNRF
jgi:hypothetical protein